MMFVWNSNAELYVELYIEHNFREIRFITIIINHTSLVQQSL